MKHILFLLFCLLSIEGLSQNYQYNGYLETAGQRMKFSLDFKLANDQSIVGTSLTAAGTADETKSAIKGRYNKSNNTLFFYETVVIYSKAKFINLNFCLLTGTLKIEDKADKGTLSGSFIGFIRGTKKQCASGKINLQGSPFVLPEREIKKPEPQLDTLYSNLGHKRMIEYTWQENKVELLVWDDYNADGDVLSISLNDKIVLNKYTLSKNKKSLILELPLNRKGNYIKIVAHDEGKAPPNTARLLLMDGSTPHGLITHIKKGEEVIINLKNSH